MIFRSRKGTTLILVLITALWSAFVFAGGKGISTMSVTGYAMMATMEGHGGRPMTTAPMMMDCTDMDKRCQAGCRINCATSCATTAATMVQSVLTFQLSSGATMTTPPGHIPEPHLNPLLRPPIA